MFSLNFSDFKLLLFVLLSSFATGSLSLPTLYQYYGTNPNGTIRTGLVANHSDYFILNGRQFLIFGGSLHYFRVLPENWQITLQKFRAVGLNTVQLYVPWNLHEESPGRFEFRKPNFDLERFLVEIRKADLFAVVRPGPYICAEWEFGGLPSWLMRDPAMKLRTNYGPFMKAATRYYKEVMRILARHQFSVNDGPIIAMQLENEYFGPSIEHSFQYLKHLRSVVHQSGFRELLFCSDPAEVARYLPLKSWLPSLLQTANLNENSLQLLSQLRANQTNRPVYVSEFWPGWFDQWGDAAHHRYNLTKFRDEVSDILFRVNGSINFYMFIGGTNFGFWNGARVTTSYDYDAPLTESGNYTDKYWETKRLYRELVRRERLPALSVPKVPDVTGAAGYGRLAVENGTAIPLEVLIRLMERTTLKKGNLVPMELLNLSRYNGTCGQSQGFVLYRIELPKATRQFTIKGSIADRTLILVDRIERAVIQDGYNGSEYRLKMEPEWFHGTGPHSVDMLVENMGRDNYGVNMTNQMKGIWGEVWTDSQRWNGNITVYSLDFKLDHKLPQTSSLFSLLPTLVSIDNYPKNQIQSGPALYRTVLLINQNRNVPLADTFLLLSGWTKGNVFVNGFNIGRYWTTLGPQRTLYIPAPLLRYGTNHIEIFELHRPGNEVQLVDRPILE